MRTTNQRFGAPYEPTFQQRIERFWGIFCCVAAMIAYGDVRLWPYAGMHLTWCFNRLIRRSNVPSIFEKRFGHPPKHDLDLRRVFGCLCFAKIKDETELHTGGARWEVGVWLGISTESAGFLVGLMVPDLRCKHGIVPGYRWTVIRNNTVKCIEQVLVEDVADLARPDAEEFCI
jgi:hypothetical protein